MNVDEVRHIMRHLHQPTTADAFCKKMGVSPQYFSDVLRGARAPGPKLLKALGLKKVVTYEPIDQ